MEAESFLEHSVISSNIVQSKVGSKIASMNSFKRMSMRSTRFVFDENNDRGDEIEVDEVGKDIKACDIRPYGSAVEVEYFNASLESFKKSSDSNNLGRKKNEAGDL